MKYYKRILSLFLIMILCSGVISPVAAAENTDTGTAEAPVEEFLPEEEELYENGGVYSVGGIRYRIYNEEAYVIGYDEVSENIVYEETLGRFVVVGIRGLMLSDKEKVKSVTLPAGIKEICDYAFADCINLETVNVYCDYVSLGKDIFANTPFIEAPEQQKGELTVVADRWLLRWNKEKSEAKVLELGTNITAVAADAFAEETYAVNLKELTVKNPDCVFNITKKVFNTSIVLKGVKGSGFAAFAKKFSYTFKSLCTHTELIYYPETELNCNGTDGFTEGYWCEACQKWESGHEKKSGYEHIDSDGNGVCDVCTAGVSIPVVKGGTRGGHTWVILENGDLIWSGEGDMLGFADYIERYEDTTTWTNDENLKELIKRVIIREGVTSVGKLMFYFLKNLEEVCLPEGLVTIGEEAFTGCSFTKINYPSTLTTIKDEAFSWCDGSFSVEIPDTVTSMGKEVFYACGRIKSVKWSNRLTYIPEGTFTSCSSVEEIILPDNVKRIGNSAFGGCSKVKELTLGNSVTEIGEGAFSGMRALEKINFNSDILTVKAKAFRNCFSLKSITLPDSVAEIGESAFEGSGLTEFVLPESCKTLGAYAFRECADLTSLVLNDALTTVGTYIVYNSGVKELKLSPGVKTYSLVFDVTQNLETVILPDGMKTVPDKYLYGNKYIKNVIIPETVTSVGAQAFYGNESLESLNLGNIEAVGKNAFYGCVALKEIDFGTALAKIEASAFEGCSSLAVINLPETLMSVGDRAFADCRSMTDVYVNSIGCNYIGTDAFIYKAVIYGYQNSAADDYAAKNGNAFIAFEEENPHEHNFVRVIDGGECQKTIRYKYTCDTCDMFYYESENYPYHVFRDGYTDLVEATCTETGKRARYCICGKDIRDYQNTPAKGHEMVIDNTAVAPTQTKPGWTQGSHCAECGIELETKIVVDPKDFEIIIDGDTVTARKSVPATYASDGRKTEIIFFTEDGTVKTDIRETVIYKIGKLELSENTYLYDGKVHRPSVTALDYKGNVIPSSQYKLTYSDKDSKNAGYYSVTVEFTGNYYGKRELYYKIKLDDVKNLRATGGENSVTLSWSKVPGAEGYNIYNSNKKLVATAYGNTYKLTGLSGAARHSFYVRAFSWTDSSIFYSQSYTNASALTLPDRVKSFKASTVKQTYITYKWDAVPGADGYRLYNYDSSKKQYKLIADTKKTSYKRKSLKAGKTYTVYIKAYFTEDGRTYESAAYTKNTSSSLLSAAKIKSVKAGKGKATVNWSKVSNADGYKIYMATSKKGTYKYIGKTSKRKLTKKGLKKGKTYYFKVRAYKTLNGKTVYGSYSSVKKVKVK